MISLYLLYFLYILVWICSYQMHPLKDGLYFCWQSSVYYFLFQGMLKDTNITQIIQSQWNKNIYQTVLKELISSNKMHFISSLYIIIWIKWHMFISYQFTLWLTVINNILWQTMIHVYQSLFMFQLFTNVLVFHYEIYLDCDLLIYIRPNNLCDIKVQLNVIKKK